MSSSILYELIGPAMAKLALTLAGAIPSGAENGETGETNAAEEQPLKNEREFLIERMREIQAEIDRNNYARSEEERAFTEAAENDETEELVLNAEKNRKFINRR